MERVVRDMGGDFELQPTYSRLEADPKMLRTFELAADRVKPTLRREDREAITRHTAVAYVLSPPVPAEEALEVSARVLALVAALLDAGALAVKGESAGLAHGARRWRELAANAVRARQRGQTVELAQALAHAWVRRPERADGLLYSCGLHLLGVRDVELDEGRNLAEDLTWIDLVALYQLAERRARLREGEPFLLPSGAARLLRLTPCERFGKADLAYNPYGYWRLERPEADAPRR